MLTFCLLHISIYIYSIIYYNIVFRRGEVREHTATDCSLYTCCIGGVHGNRGRKPTFRITGNNTNILAEHARAHTRIQRSHKSSLRGWPSPRRCRRSRNNTSFLRTTLCYYYYYYYYTRVLFTIVNINKLPDNIFLFIFSFRTLLYCITMLCLSSRWPSHFFSYSFFALTTWL